MNNEKKYIFCRRCKNCLGEMETTVPVENLPVYCPGCSKDKLFAPFTIEEEEIMRFLTMAHNNFIKLERTHPQEIDEWITSVHRLQDLLGMRILRRDYPETFPTYPENIKEKD